MLLLLARDAGGRRAVRWSGRALGGHGEEVAEKRGSVLRADAFGMELGMRRGGTERVSWVSRRKGR